MPALSEKRLAELLQPYLEGFFEGGSSTQLTEASELLEKCSIYLDLLLTWNARTNLTAIRSAEEIVQRHFGESFFVGYSLREQLRAGAQVLDFGSGAGFPGLPMQLLLHNVRVTLAESQGKKSAFLREAVRRLGVPAEVWSGRVEDLPMERTFDAVALRAVDDMARMLPVGSRRVKTGGLLVEIGTDLQDWEGEALRIPGLTHGWVRFSWPNG